VRRWTRLERFLEADSRAGRWGREVTLTFDFRVFRRLVGLDRHRLVVAVSRGSAHFAIVFNHLLWISLAISKMQIFVTTLAGKTLTLDG
jgi:hypothetical protein